MGHPDSEPALGGAAVFTVLAVAYCGNPAAPNISTAIGTTSVSQGRPHSGGPRTAARFRRHGHASVSRHAGALLSADSATLLHDLTFLDAAEIHAPEILLISLSFEQEHLKHWGTVEKLDQSPSIDRGVPHAGQLRRPPPEVQKGRQAGRRPLPPHPPLQAMHRRPGPLVPYEDDVILGEPGPFPKQFVTPVGYHDSDERTTR